MIEKLDRSSGSVVGIRVSGKLTEDDYDRLLPELERIIDEHGALDVLCRFDGFSGVEAQAVWEDFKFYVNNMREIRRCAVIKDSDWQGALARLGGLFGVNVRVYDPPEEEEAWDWLFSEAEAEAATTPSGRDKRRAQLFEQRLDRLVKDLRVHAGQGEDPQLKALFETSAEVLTGLKKALKHYKTQSEPAWQE